MALARWLVQKVQSGSEETVKESSSTPDNEQMQLLITEAEISNEIQLTNPTSQLAILIPHKASQTILSFPLRTFGKQQRGFNTSWYKTFPWLHYQEGSDSVLCFYCLVADKRGLKISGYMDEMFTNTGFSNWKKAIEKFEKHQTSKSHREAIDLVIKIPSPTKDVGEMLNRSHAEQKDENRQVLLKIFSSVRYLSRQGIAFRGRWKTDEPEILNCESDSNFIQLLRIRAEDNPILHTWMDKCQDKFTSQTYKMKSSS